MIEINLFSTAFTLMFIIQVFALTCLVQISGLDPEWDDGVPLLKKFDFLSGNTLHYIKKYLCKTSGPSINGKECNSLKNQNNYTIIYLVTLLLLRICRNLEKNWKKKIFTPEWFILHCIFGPQNLNYLRSNPFRNFADLCLVEAVPAEYATIILLYQIKSRVGPIDQRGWYRPCER